MVVCSAKTPYRAKVICGSWRWEPGTEFEPDLFALAFTRHRARAAAYVKNSGVQLSGLAVQEKDGRSVRVHQLLSIVLSRGDKEHTQWSATVGLNLAARLCPRETAFCTTRRERERERERVVSPLHFTVL